MYSYVLNYDKATKVDNDYSEIIKWVKKQDSYKELSESVHFFKTREYSNDVVKKLEELFFEKDTVSLIYIRKDSSNGSYAVEDSSNAYLHVRDFKGTKK